MVEVEAFARFATPLPEPHLLVSPGANILAANPAAREAFALTENGPGEFTPPSLAALVEDSPDRLATFLRSCSRTNRMIPAGLSLKGGRNEGRYMCSGARMGGGTNGKVEGICILLRFRRHQEAVQTFQLLNRQIDRLSSELHHRRRIEAELRAQAQQLREYALELEVQRERAESASRAKSEFLGAMSHELRTPLNAIVGYVDLLDAEVSGPVNQRQREQLDRIRRGARHLVTFIVEILEFSRMDSGAERVNATEVDLRQVAQEALEMVEPAAAEADLEVRLTLPADPVEMVTDGPKVRQALLNLLSNGVKFTPGGGSVTLTLSMEEGEEDTPPRARFSVRDTGIGIAPAHDERIFEPFWQVGKAGRGHLGGLGLGLPVAREIARLLGGKIEMTSALGEGSSFTLTIPPLGGLEG